MNPYKLQPWITGGAYNYSDGEIWPELKYNNWRMLAWRAALKCGFKSRTRERYRGHLWPKLAVSMIGERRAINIIDSVRALANVPGALVDCGVWRGGSTILMQSSNLLSVFGRRVYCCDTFDGFPPEDARREQTMCPNALRVSLKEVQNNFEKFGVSTAGVEFIQGKVQDTLSRISGPVALLRTDVDFYYATLSCLEQIYPIMPQGGIVICDDYGCSSFQAKRAVDDFRKTNKVATPLNWIDDDGVWWRKE